MTLDSLHQLAEQRARERRGLVRKEVGGGDGDDDEELRCRGAKQAKLSDGTVSRRDSSADGKCSGDWISVMLVLCGLPSLT